MGKRKVGALEKVDADLANLQNKVRRDPIGYQDDFLKQYEQFKSQHDIYSKSPETLTDTGLVFYKDLIDFVAHTAECYPVLTADFPKELTSLLHEHHAHLEPNLREKLVTSLVLLRRKGVIDSSYVISALFPVLTTTGSKALRTLILQKILSDLRNSNAKRVDHRLNRSVQNELNELVKADPSSPKALWAVKIVRELWKRRIWTGEKPVRIMCDCCMSDNLKVIGGAVRFFLGSDKEREEFQDESSDEEGPDIGRLQHQMGINKKTKKKAKAVQNAVSKAKKKAKHKNGPDPLNNSAIWELLNAHQFAQDLFEKHLHSSKSRLGLELKLEILQLVTRIVGSERLIIPPLYSYFLKYLIPRQQMVTSFLACLAQATHKHIPPEELEPLVQKIANEFVSEAAASEVAAAGLSAIREICARQPAAMNETLLQDLVRYRKSKDKGVMMAARGLLSVYRLEAPSMLKARDRGKEGAMGLSSGERMGRRYGEVEPGEIAGLEELAETWDADHDDEDPNAWDEQAESDSSGEWIEVSSDEELDIGGIGPVEDVENGDDEVDEEKDGTEPSEEDSGESEELDEAASDEDSLTNEESLVDQETPSEPRPKRTKLSTSKEPTPLSTTSAGHRSWQEIASTRILTPADLAQLSAISLKQSAMASLSSRKTKHSIAQQRIATRHSDEPLTKDDIEVAASLGKKLTKEEKVALAKEGKGDRSEHKSTHAIHQSRKNAAGKSTTNREKARRKNQMMMLGKARSKNKRSLTEKRKILKAHVERQKRGGRRGNKGN